MKTVLHENLTPMLWSLEEEVKHDAIWKAHLMKEQTFSSRD